MESASDSSTIGGSESPRDTRPDHDGLLPDVDEMAHFLDRMEHLAISTTEPLEAQITRVQRDVDDENEYRASSAGAAQSDQHGTAAAPTNGRDGTDKPEALVPAPVFASLADWKNEQQELLKAKRARSGAKDAATAKVLWPRQYQIQLLERAKQENIIACLGTGAGKTLVAVKLLEYMANKERLEAEKTGRTKRISLFLLNSVPLVHQQAEVITNNTPLGVAKLFGELDVDTWHESQWHLMLHQDRCNVVVSTAQIILDGLNRAFIKMRDVNLIVFDEAHHVQHSDPYARIMRVYDAAPEAERPKIFGMTASPLKSGASFAEASSTLERVLHARIFTAPVSAREELERVVSKPLELVVEFDPPPREFEAESELTKLVLDSCGHMEGIEGVLIRVDYAREEYGPLMADLIWRLSSSDVSHRARRAKELSLLSAPEIELLDRDLKRSRELGSLLRKSTETDDDHKQRLTVEAEVNQAVSRVLKDVQLPPRVSASEANCTPKILTLLRLLHCFGRSERVANDFCGIVFVERRLTAMALADLIQRTPSLSFLRAEYLVGHDAQGETGMDWKSQTETLARFRRRQPTNLLIATSVLEEGLDITPCNLVLRFDLFRAHISYVQSRGRARHTNSRYIIMAQKHSRRDATLIRKTSQTEAAMKGWLTSLPEDRMANILQDDEGDDEAGFTAVPRAESEIAGILEGVGLEPDLNATQSYKVEQTGAVLYPVDSIALLYYYVALLEADGTSPTVPIFQLDSDRGQKRCMVSLPANAKIRSQTGPWCKSQRAAKQMVAFQTCVELHRLGELTDSEWRKRVVGHQIEGVSEEHPTSLLLAAETIPSLLIPSQDLVPHRRIKQTSLLPFERDTKGRRLATRIRERRYLGKHADELCSAYDAASFLGLPDAEALASASKQRWPNVAWATQLRVPGWLDGLRFRDLVIVTRQPLPVHMAQPFELFFIGQTRTFPGLSESVRIELGAAQVDDAAAHTLRLLRWVGRRAWTCPLDRMPYFVLPLKGEVATLSSVDDISWDEVARAGKDVAETQSLAESGLFDSLADEPGALTDRVLTEHRWALGASAYEVMGIRHDLNPFSHVEPSAPLREAAYGSFWAYHRDLLHRNVAKPLKEPKMQPLFAVSKMGRMGNFLSRTAQKRQGNKRTEAKFLIPEFTFVHCLSASVMRSAVAFPSIVARLEQVCLAAEASRTLFENRLGPHLVPAFTSPQAEMAIDYQRLEFLGDTLLKLIGSCWVFASCGTWDQHALHLARARLVCNAKLLSHAERLKLQRFVAAEVLSATSWKPPGFVDPPKHLPPTLQHVGKRRVNGVVTEESNYRAKVLRAKTPGSGSEGEAVGDGQREERANGGPSEQGGATGRDANSRTRVGRRFRLSEKGLADVVEACLGAAFEQGGPDLALEAGNCMGILPEPVATYASFAQRMGSHASSFDDVANGPGDTVRVEALHKLEALLGYRFRQPRLALEALTHSSVFASDLASYERLELLGDAVLDYHVVCWLAREHPHMDEGGLTTLKGNAVSNVALAALAETLGLQRFLHHYDAGLMRTVHEFVEDVREAREKNEQRPREERKLYWLGLQAPKAVADIVESLMGAVFVDAGFDLKASEDLFNRIHLPFFREHCRPDTSVIQNTAELSAVIESHRCRAWRTFHAEANVGVRGDNIFAGPVKFVVGHEFRILCHGHVVGQHVASNRLEAEAQACRQVLDRIRNEGLAMLETMCDCRELTEEEKRRRDRRTRRRERAAEARRNGTGSAAERNQRIAGSKLEVAVLRKKEAEGSTMAAATMAKGAGDCKDAQDISSDEGAEESPDTESDEDEVKAADLSAALAPLSDPKQADSSMALEASS